MRYLRGALLPVIAFAILWAWIPPSAQARPAGRDDIVRVGRFENPPKVYTDASGASRGLFPELLEAVATDEGWTLDWVDCAWPACLALLKDGQLDLLPDVAFSQERATWLDFGQVPVTVSWSQILAAPALRVSKYPDLEGARVALVRGGSEQAAFTKLRARAKIAYIEVPVDSDQAAYAAVVAGRADVAISNTFYATYYNSRFGLRETPLKFLPRALSFASPKGSGAERLAAIDRHLTAWRADPNSIYWQALHRAMDPIPTSFLPRWVTRALLSLALALLLLLLVAGWLRRQVRERTRNLMASKARNVELVQLDQLTGLPNRSRYVELLSRAVSRAETQLDTAALIFLDIDGFAGVNEGFGHRAGDRVLVELVRRLRTVLAPPDVLARTGGDEFAVIVAGAQNIGGIAQNLIDVATEPVVIDGRRIFVGLSAGVAVFPTDGTDLDSLQSGADAALQVAKAGGQQSLRYASPEFTRIARERQDLLAALRGAVDGNELRIQYQPQMLAASGLIVGVEALLRWERPGFGLVQPNDFIPLAEESGLIVPIGAWVLATVCEQVRVWTENKIAPVTTALNLSAVQLGDPLLAENVQGVIEQTGISPAALELEITETFVMRDPVQCFSTFADLRALGVTMSIDDFGTGYSSMRYLQELQVHRLKLDMSFVHGMLGSESATAIVRAIIVMGHSLGLEVVAEGVETPEQLQRLREYDCDVIQGFLVGRPCDAEVMTQLLRSGSIPLV